MKPLVSVIIPNYNHARFLDKRIQSILGQTYQNFEVLFLDDCSTDDSLAVFSRYAGDPRVRLIQNTVNSGSPFKQWNKGVREARGEYVWIAESDDYAEPQLLELLAAELERHPAVGLAYCQSMAVDETEKPLYNLADWTKDLDAARWTKDFVNNGRDECHRYLIVQNTIPNASAVVFRKELYVRAEGADEAYRTCADWLLWAKILSLSDVAFVAQPLNFFRRHSASVIGKNQGTLIAPLESYQVVKQISSLVPPAAESHKLACSILRSRWLHPMHGRSINLKRLKDHVRIHRAARGVDKSINYWLLRKLFACAIRGK